MILAKTEAGQQVFKDRSVRLTPRQRSAFILCDGRRSVGDVLASGMGIGQQDIDQMIELGLLGPVAGAVTTAANAERAELAPAVPVPASETAPSPAVVQQPVAAPPRSNQARYQEAYPIATKLTAGLGLRGFRLNLAVEAASTYEQLAALAPKICSAVGEDKAQPLLQALA